MLNDIRDPWTHVASCHHVRESRDAGGSTHHHEVPVPEGDFLGSRLDVRPPTPDRHQFDANGREILPATHVGEVGLTTSGDVLEEARTIWLATRDVGS